MEFTRFKITKDNTVFAYFESLSLGKHRINFLIENNLIKLKKNSLTKDYLLKKGDIVTVDLSLFEKSDYLPISYPLEILYEDEYLMVVNKPYDVIIYPETKDGVNTLANYVRYYYQQKGINRSIRHVHRLDKDTTGCILYAKDFITHAALTKMIEEKEIKRIYRARVMGKMLKNQGVIDKPIAKDRHINNKMVVSKTGKRAITLYTVIEYDKMTDTSLLELELKTGRTHQIRVHLANLNHPLIGDKIYGEVREGDHLQLVSYSLEFVHPITCEKINVKLK